MKRLVMSILIPTATLATAAFGAEKFQKLSGGQIRARISGMEMTDSTHFSDVFAAGGGLASYGMGKKKTGKWWVQKDELCVDRGKDDGGCYQVWVSGKKIEFRREGSDFALQEGMLKAATSRD
jgi:hypothetical protein